MRHYAHSRIFSVNERMCLDYLHTLPFNRRDRASAWGVCGPGTSLPWILTVSKHIHARPYSRLTELSLQTSAFFKGPQGTLMHSPGKE